MTSARDPVRLRIHPRSSPWLQSAFPSRPAKCERLSLQSRQSLQNGTLLLRLSAVGVKSILTLSLAMAVALFAQIGILTHLVSLLGPVVGVQGAGLAAGLSTAAAIFGRQCVGWFMPASADRRIVASISLLVQMLGCMCLLLAAGGFETIMIVGVVFIGLGIGNATSLPPLIVQIEFSKSDSARVVALIVAISQAHLRE